MTKVVYMILTDCFLYLPTHSTFIFATKCCFESKLCQIARRRSGELQRLQRASCDRVTFKMIPSLPIILYAGLTGIKSYFHCQLRSDFVGVMTGEAIFASITFDLMYYDGLYTPFARQGSKAKAATTTCPRTSTSILSGWRHLNLPTKVANLDLWWLADS